MVRPRLRARLRRSIAIVAGLVAVTSVLAAPASASPTTLPTPTLVGSSVSSSVTAPCGPPDCSVPAVIVALNSPFTLTVTLTASGAPAAFKTNTTLTLTAPGPGVLSPTSVTMPANQSSAQFTLTYSAYANGVTVTATAGTGRKAPAATPSNAFDVLQTIKTDTAGPNTPFQDGAGLGDCASVSAGNPVCAIVILPNGANSNVLLSTGSCTGIGCNTKGTVTQVIADLSSQPLYSSTSPAEMFIRCYRTVCGSGGVNKYTVVASVSATGGLAASPACPAKMTIGTGQDFCTDYVSSNRANADELDLVLLFDHDFRGSIA